MDCSDFYHDEEDIKDYRQENKRTMTTKITGAVEYINEYPGAYGTMYGIKVNGTNYSSGKKNAAAAAGVSKGDRVSFHAEQNAKGYWDIKGPIKKEDAAPAGVTRSAPSSAAAPSGGGSRFNPEADAAKQRSISRQAAANTAVEFLKLCQSAGALPTPKTKGDAYEALHSYFVKLREEFYEYSQNGAAAPAAVPGTPASFTELENKDEWPE